MVNNIYFATALAGGRGDINIGRAIVGELKKKGVGVPTEHLILDDPMAFEDDWNRQMMEQGKEANVFERDIEWLTNCQAMVVEASKPSIGVGREIEYALNWLGIPVLVLYQKGVFLTRMLSHDKHNLLHIREYGSLEEIIGHVNGFLDYISRSEEEEE